MTAYYNEIDPFAAQWLRNLISENLIAEGEVDERDIRNVSSKDIEGYDQHHFFAGIGGWSLSLRIAGWPDSREVWTGSCPCQPFSVAGKRAGFADDRHLWPQFRRLIEKRRPSVVFGEQVAGAPDWIRLVRSDLEAMGYAVGAIPLEAASADAEHFRDRYWFVAHHDKQFPGQERQRRGREFSGAGGNSQDHDLAVANGHSERPQVAVGQQEHARTERPSSQGNSIRDVVDLTSVGWGERWTESEFRGRGFAAAVASVDGRQYVECPDGKWRRLPPPRVRWLGARIPARVDKLRAIGNAIDPRPAAQFIGAYMDAVMECAP